MTGYLRHFQSSNRNDLSKFTPFYIGEQQLGWIHNATVQLFAELPDYFTTRPNAIAMAPHLKSFDARSDVLSAITEKLLAHFGKKLRHEMYPLITEWGDEPLAQVDRIAVPWLGTRAFGLHVNGYVRKKDRVYLWVGERAQNRPAEPGKLDNLIGGGQPIGLSLEENLCKEAKEEAGIAPGLARTAVAVGSIRYLLQRPEGLRNDTLFLYDLELPDGYTPHNTDGEVAAFHLFPIQDVAAIVRDTDRFKFNCNLVIIDFLMRHRFLQPEHEEYAAIKKYTVTPAQA